MQHSGADSQIDPICLLECSPNKPVTGLLTGYLRHRQPSAAGGFSSCARVEVQSTNKSQREPGLRIAEPQRIPPLMGALSELTSIMLLSFQIRVWVFWYPNVLKSILQG